jgi:hypothetical protein
MMYRVPQTKIVCKSYAPGKLTYQLPSSEITFALLKALPYVKHWWETYSEKMCVEESKIYGAEPTWDFFVDAVKEQYYPLLAQGQTQGSTLQQRTNKALTTGPFGNTCEADEVSPEVEAGVVARLRCLQP